MQIAIVENGAVTQVGDYRELFPNTSFTVNGPSDEWLTQNNAKKVTLFKPYDALTQKLVPAAAHIDGDFVSLVEVADMTADEIQAAKDSAMSNVRAQRNRLLSDCDWTQLSDSPVDKSAWASYRQQLRDLPAGIVALAIDPRTFNDWPHDPNWVEPTGSV